MSRSVLSRGGYGGTYFGGRRTTPRSGANPSPGTTGHDFPCQATTFCDLVVLTVVVEAR
jgi:hypothetical protein